MKVLLVVSMITGLWLAARTKTEMKPETSVVSAGAADNISIVRKDPIRLYRIRGSTRDFTFIILISSTKAIRTM